MATNWEIEVSPLVKYDSNFGNFLNSNTPCIRAHGDYSTTRLDVDNRRDTRAPTGDDINY